VVLSPYATKQQTIWEVAVAASKFVESPYGMVCTECDELVIAPEWSAHVNKGEIRHFWRCESCGHAIELAVNLSFDSASRPSDSAGSSAAASRIA
jgi:hypothetical protein